MSDHETDLDDERPEDYTDIVERLDVVGEAERADIARALADPVAPSSRAEAALRELIAAPSAAAASLKSPRSLRQRHPWIAVAAAAILVVFFWFNPYGSGPEEEETFLGPDVELVHPSQESANFDHFEWKHAGEPNGWYRVIVHPEDGSEPTDSGPLRTNSWQPTVEQKSQWGTQIRWTLEVYGGTSAGDMVTSQTERAWLSGR